MQPPRATIVGISATLDQPGFLQPVDDPAQSDRFDVKVIGKFDLSQPGLAPQPRQHPPLGAGHAERRGATVKCPAQAKRGFRKLERNIF